MKHSKSKKNRWEDHYSRKAKKEHFPARSVYKLQEIHKKNGLIKKRDRVLDLGCAPGSWLLYAAELTGNRGKVVGIDLNPLTIQLPTHVSAHVADVFSQKFPAIIGKNFNVVLSDMAPVTIGNKRVDAARSFELCRTALSIAQKVLVPGGSFVCKIFQGEDFKPFSDSVKACFKQHKIFKPQSSRKGSKEIYIIGIGMKEVDCWK